MLTLKPNAEQLALIELARREGEIIASRLAMEHVDLRQKRSREFKLERESRKLDLNQEIANVLMSINLDSPKFQVVVPAVVRNIQRSRSSRIHLTTPIAKLHKRNYDKFVQRRKYADLIEIPANDPAEVLASR